MDLDRVDVRVAPVALRDVEEVHQRVVLGVSESLAYLHSDAVLLAHPLHKATRKQSVTLTSQSAHSPADQPADQPAGGQRWGRVHLRPAEGGEVLL